MPKAGNSIELYYKGGLQDCLDVINAINAAQSDTCRFHGNVISVGNNNADIRFMGNHVEFFLRDLSLRFTLDYLPDRHCTRVKMVTKKSDGQEILEKVIELLGKSRVCFTLEASKQSSAGKRAKLSQRQKRSIAPSLVAMCISFSCSFCCLAVSIFMLIDPANLWTPFIIFISLFACFMVMGFVSLAFLRKAIRHNRLL